MILTRKYAMSLIRAGKAVREYEQMLRITEERKLDALYAVLRRDDAQGNVRFDHFVA